MPLYLLSEPTEPLVAPAIVAALDGWIDAAGASTAAAERLADGAAPLATFDADLLFDFRSRRPVLDVVDGRLSELTWPELTLRHRRLGEPRRPGAHRRRARLPVAGARAGRARRSRGGSA